MNLKKRRRPVGLSAQGADSGHHDRCGRPDGGDSAAETQLAVGVGPEGVDGAP